MFKDVKYDIPLCQYHSTRPQPIQLVPTMQKKLFTSSFQAKFLKLWFTKVAGTSIKSYVPADFLFSQCKVVLGACFWAIEPHWAAPGTPFFLSLFRLKEPERGWKRDVKTLSWESGWKPLKRRKFRLEVMVVWSWNSCVRYIHHYDYSFCSIDLTKSRYTWSRVSRKRDIWVSQGIPKLIPYKRSFKQPLPANNPQK